MPMNNLRNRQIREALDEDKNMYAKVFELEKRRVQVMDEAPQQYQQLNAESLGQVGELVQALKMSLEKKISPMLLLDKNQDEAKNAPELGQIEETLKYYNMIASIFMNPANTPYTKDMILSKMVDVERPIIQLLAGCNRYLIKLKDPQMTIQARRDKYFTPVLRAQNVYDLMIRYIHTKILKVITEQDLNANVGFRPMMKKFHLNPPDYSGTGGPPPPPGGPGGPGGGPGGDYPPTFQGPGQGAPGGAPEPPGGGAPGG